MVAVARTVGGLEELDDKIKAAGGSATLVPLDMKDSDGIARLALALNERYQRLDVLVGNAGMLGSLSPLAHVEPKDWDNLIAVNVTANWQLIRCMDTLLQRSPAGRAVFLTSGVAHMARPYWGALRGVEGGSRSDCAHLCGGMRDHARACQSIRTRPDPYAHVCQRFSGHRSADAPHAGGSRTRDLAVVPAGLRRNRETLQFPRAQIYGFSYPQPDFSDRSMFPLRAALVRIVFFTQGETDWRPRKIECLAQ